MRRKRQPTTDAVEIMHRRYFEGKPDMLAMLEQVRGEAEIARQVYSLRNEAGLTQRQLAKRVGVKASEIDDIEEADYEGNYLAMLYRIAAALKKRVAIRFVSLKDRAAGA